MVARVSTIAFDGIKPCHVDVQVQIFSGLRAFTIVGLADKAVAESKERVRAALNHVGLALPSSRITVNLAPADFPKEGSHYDLPIALAIMVAMEVLPQSLLDPFVAVGELALDGSLSPVPGVLPSAIGANACGKGLICPAASGSEAAWADPEMQILAPENLSFLVDHLRGNRILNPPEVKTPPDAKNLPDLSEIRGQESARRALEVSAAGGHNFLMIGPPGSGKSMLAHRLPSILPPLDSEEVLEVSMIHSIAGLLEEGRIHGQRPFRSPHHSSSMAALIGGGHKGRPGEVSLAHLGVLFLDEFPEFPAHVLDSLRQPLEDGEVSIARVNRHVTYPARFQLVAAMNPCRCGMAGTAGHVCARGTRCVTDYQAKISGPMLDRIDLRIEVPAMSAKDLSLPPPKEGSAQVRARIVEARRIQKARFARFGMEKIRVNAHCPVQLLDEILGLDKDGQAILTLAAEKMRLSARSYHRVLKVARTIADLAGENYVLRQHIAEALAYRGPFRAAGMDTG